MGAAGWIAAATLAPLAGEVAGEVVVVVVEGGVLDCSTTTRAPTEEVVAGGGDDEVGGVTALGPGPGAVVVVVVAAGAGAADPAWWRTAGWWGAAVRLPGFFGRSAAAATKARRETDTARTAHQCGRMRRAGGPPAVLHPPLSPATA
jgi:hypothetical protein